MLEQKLTMYASLQDSKVHMKPCVLFFVGNLKKITE